MFGLGEVFEHFLGGAEEDELAAAIQKDRLVKHLEDFRSRLVNRDEDDLVVRHAADDLNDVLGILGRETAGGLVEEVHVGGTDHVEADIEAFAFAAGEGLFVGGSDDRAAAFVEAEFGQFAVDAPEAFAAGEMGGPEASGEVDVFLNGEVFIERVVLGDIGHVTAEAVVAAVERAPIKEDIALVGRELAG